MEFNKKLQELRKQKGLTQEELAEKLYVSRAAISKWESGRGYPSIDSLKLIARFFSVTVDELLSSNEILTIAEKSQKQNKEHTCNLIFGLLDICMALLLFLPFFATNNGEIINESSLLSINGISLYLKISYIAIVAIMCILGILTLLLQGSSAPIWLKLKAKASLLFSVVAVLLFIISRQPYAASFAFSLLMIKIIMLIKHI
jgi:transcriptional regulator with XRE-family HTH domain